MLLDLYSPMRGAHYLAKHLGFSEQIVRAGFGYISSPRRMRRSFAGYQATGRDVFAATYPKSGTNWSMQIALQIAWRGKAEFGHIHDRVPWPGSPDPRVVIPLDDARSWQGSPTGLRVIKTHLTPTYVPWNPETKYIIVLRDPKEVLVSGYHFVTPLLGVSDTVSPQDWLRLNRQFSERNGDPWLRHTLDWWNLRNRDNVLVLEYAKMKQDLPGTVDQVATLVGVSLTSAERHAVIERSGLPWMKAHRSQFASVKLPFANPTGTAEIVRRGVSGGTDELYSREELASLERIILDQLESQASDFPYRELFAVYAAEGR